jgi:hypothetical protein
VAELAEFVAELMIEHGKRETSVEKYFQELDCLDVGLLVKLDHDPRGILAANAHGDDVKCFVASADV